MVTTFPQFIKGREADGTPLASHQLEVADAVEIRFDNSSNGFAADNAQDAIEEAKFISTTTLHDWKITSTLLITAFRQYLIFGPLIIESTINIDTDGKLVIL